MPVDPAKMLMALLVAATPFFGEEATTEPAATSTATAQVGISASRGEQTPTTYYFISDLHIGGDGGLDHCGFEGELIAFLRGIAAGPLPAELIIVGDAFGLWEMTADAGDQKLERIAQSHKALFAQFRETGSRLRITLLPGNHDYDLACVPAYGAQLAAYSIHLEPVVHITRKIAGRTIWIEHGNQRDEFNRFPEFGDRFGMPPGYFITTSTVAAAARAAQRGQSDWLNDLESVYPSEAIPSWIWSNYFYKEMTPILRWFLLPFLLLSGVSLIVLIGRGLARLGVPYTKIFQGRLGHRLGWPGRLVDGVLFVNGIVLTAMLVLAIPAYLLARDVRAALHRFGVESSEGLVSTKDDGYVKAAKAVFERDESAALFIYGHTHVPSVRKVASGYVVNTGTWLKRLDRVRGHFRLLPDVYVPSYRLNYFTISQEGQSLRLSYHVIPKKAPDDLTWLERLQILGRRPTSIETIPPELAIRP
ncbi:MAG: metallophosphoesterase [Phycisphaerae bacterium]|nr:metallophosphoesterase [Phycisphaerae bacterium]